MNRLITPGVKRQNSAAARPYYLGLDGCRGGWAAVRIASRDRPVSIFMAAALEAIKEDILGSERVFIDIPVGLKTQGAPERDCDVAARKQMASRKASVFRVPVRSAVYAKDYRQALSLQRRHTGSGMSIQSWNIASKIRETDVFLRREKDGRSRVYESHPELCFSILKGSPLDFSKKTGEGISERIRILSNLQPDIEKSIEEALAFWPRSVMRIDDVVDACVLAVSARSSSARGMRILPETPPLDRCGLPMRIVCPAGKGGTR